MVNQSKVQNPGPPGRIVVLVDAYTFATQVMAKHERNPNWNTGPSVTALRTGRIISANLYAKKLGINNSIKLKQAIGICPNLTIFFQPTYDWGKPDQTLFRIAGNEVFKCIQNDTSQWHCPPILHWVPQDEMYLDITDQVNYIYENRIAVPETKPTEVNIEHCHIIAAITSLVVRPEQLEGPKWPLHKSEDPQRIQNYRGKNEEEEKLIIASKLISPLQKKIQEKTLFHCSAGIGPNKMLAKIACSLNPPGSLSTLNQSGILKSEHSEKVTLKKLSPLDSWVKRILESYGITTMAQVQQIAWQDLARMLNSKKEAFHTKAVVRGEDPTPVVERIFTKYVNCARNYFHQIHHYERLCYEVDCLVQEMEVRLREQLSWYNRRPSRIQLVIKFVRGYARTRTIPLQLDAYNDQAYMQRVIWWNKLPFWCGIVRLRLAALNFE